MVNRNRYLSIGSKVTSPFLDFVMITEYGEFGVIYFGKSLLKI